MRQLLTIIRQVFFAVTCLPNLFSAPKSLLKPCMRQSTSMKPDNSKIRSHFLPSVSLIRDMIQRGSVLLIAFTNKNIVCYIITSISNIAINMKRHLCMIIFCVSYFYCSAQIRDTALLAHSDKWKVKLHRGMFGMAKPEFGPFTTNDIEKLDSPVLRKRTKEGSYTGASYSSEGWDWDFSKYQTVEKRKAYRMVLTGGSDTAELLFSFYRISNEKNLTFFGELMSKNDEGKNQPFADKTIVSGLGITSYDSLPWRFFLEDSFDRKEEAVPTQTTRFTSAYIITHDDSLFTEPILNSAGSRNGRFFLEWQTGVFINSSKSNHIAALKFGTPGDLSNPFLAWIRNDMVPSQQHAIASVFALLISAKSK